MLNKQTSRKITDLCEQFTLYQTIREPIHFTKNSSSLIDIILTRDKSNIIYNGVTEPFLHQEIRYHCHVYGIFKFSKHTRKSFTRHIWSYNQGDYDSLKPKVSNTDWDFLFDPDINIYTRNFTGHLNSLTVECILNEPPHDKTNKMACAPSEDSDQPGHPPSLIRVFAVRMKKAGILTYPLSASEDSDRTGRTPKLT